MTEVLIERKDRLEFSLLNPGDLLTITTGNEPEAWIYNFITHQASRWPTGSFQAFNPTGEESEALEFELHGSGNWTNRRQNPVQTQDRAFTACYEGLRVGNFLLGRVVGQKDRLVFDKPRQQISELALTPYRKNTILQALGAHADAMSVRQMVEAIDNASPHLEERDIRDTLAQLVSLGLIEQHRKKVLQYELAEASQ